MNIRWEISKDRLKIIWLITLFTAFLSGALYIKGFESFFPYRIMMGLHLLVFAIYFIQQRRINISKRLYPYYIFLAVWAGWAMVSLTWAANKGYAIRGIFLFFSDAYPLIFTPYYLDDQKDYNKILNIVVAAFFISITIALIERLTGCHLPQSLGNVYRGLDKTIPTAFYRNPNDFAAYLIMYLPIIYVMFKYSRKPAYWLYVAFAIGISDLLATSSRASDLALLMVAIFAFVLPRMYSSVHHFQWPKREKMRMFLAWLTVAFILFMNNQGFTINGLLMKYVQNTKIKDDRGLEFGKQMESIINFEKRSSNSVYVRIKLIENGFKILNAKPVRYITGVGVGNIEEYMKSYMFTTNKTLNVHNWWFEILFDYGIFILLGFIAFYLKILWELFKIYIYSENEEYRQLAEGLLLSMIAFSLASISPSSIVSLTSMWIVFAISIALIKTAAVNVPVAKGFLCIGKKFDANMRLLYVNKFFAYR